MTTSPDNDGLAFDCEVEAPPEKVFRALTVPAFVERWLKPGAAIEAEVVEATPETVRWRWREIGEPEGFVTFSLTPTESGGTMLRLVHVRTQPALQPTAANRNDITMMLAA